MPDNPSTARLFFRGMCFPLLIVAMILGLIGIGFGVTVSVIHLSDGDIVKGCCVAMGTFFVLLLVAILVASGIAAGIDGEREEEKR